MTTAEIDALLTKVKSATGAERSLDRAIHAALVGGGDEVPRYTASVDACIELVHNALPGWGWHIGFGPLGIIPYASLHKGEARLEASAPTVPLALLTAAIAAARADR